MISKQIIDKAVLHWAVYSAKNENTSVEYIENIHRKYITATRYSQLACDLLFIVFLPTGILVQNIIPKCYYCLLQLNPRDLALTVITHCFTNCFAKVNNTLHKLLMRKISSYSNVQFSAPCCTSQT